MHSILVQQTSGGDLRTSPKSLLLAQAAFVALYATVLFWFGWVDVYNHHFFMPGLVYVGYAVARVLFVAYLGWIQFCVGFRCMQHWVKRGASFDLDLLDQFIVSFFAGGAVLAGATFVLGFLNLYYYWFFVLVTTGLVAWTSAMLPVTRAWRDGFLQTIWGEQPVLRRLAHVVAFACVAFLAVMLLVIKGLYPGGGGDYYTHYFPYFRHVIQSHGLWPNDVWYHFYISKGATITLSSILLTDLQAPEIVTYLYFMVASLAVYSLVRRWVPDSVVPWVGMAACIGGFLWTVHPIYSEWGHFQKHHEFTTSLIVSVLWLAAIAPARSQGATLKAWMSFFALALGHLVLFMPTMSVLMSAVLIATLAAALLCRAWGLVSCLMAGLAGAGVVFTATLVINYACTGMADITPMRAYWKFADQERLSHWISPYLMSVLLEGSSETVGSTHFAGKKDLHGLSRTQYYHMLTRTESIRAFFPDIAYARAAADLQIKPKAIPTSMIVVMSIIAALVLCGRRLPFPAWRLAVPVLTAFVVGIVVSTLGGQPVSTFRCFSFFVFLSVLIALGLWTTLLQLLPLSRLATATLFVLPAALTGVITYQSMRALPSRERKNCLHFVAGRSCLAEGFRERRVTSDIPVAIREVIGKSARVYSFDLNCYTMAPGCELETFVSFSLGRDYHEVLFESPARARAALENQQLDYFLVDLEGKALGLEILQFAPLFHPDNIAKHLALRWRRGNVFLLSWPGPDTTPLPDDFLSAYAASCNGGMSRYRPLYERLVLLYDLNGRKAYPVHRPADLPPVTGWQ